MRIGGYVGCYRLVRLVAQGGMGAVYEGLNEQLGRRVAIKLIHDALVHDREQCARFFNEAYVVNLIHHPSLVAIHEYGQLPDASPYIVMEYLEGQTLAQRLRARGAEPLPISQVVRIARQVAAGLAAAHERGIVHRDLKPDNLMLTADPEVPGGERVKILDFGIAKVRLAQPVTEPAGATRKGAWMGTPGYIAPEQIYGANSVDGRADVYSLGVLLYELLSGSRPFRAESAEQELRFHMTAVPPPLHQRAPATPAALASLVHAMLAKQPHERPAMREVGELLQGMEFSTNSSLPVGQTAATPITTRSVAGVASAALLLVGMILIVGTYWRSDSGTPYNSGQQPLAAHADGGIGDLAPQVKTSASAQQNELPTPPADIVDMATQSTPDLARRLPAKKKLSEKDLLKPDVFFHLH